MKFAVCVQHICNGLSLVLSKWGKINKALYSQKFLDWLLLGGGGFQLSLKRWPQVPKILASHVGPWYPKLWPKFPNFWPKKFELVSFFLPSFSFFAGPKIFWAQGTFVLGTWGQCIFIFFVSFASTSKMYLSFALRMLFALSFA